MESLHKCRYAGDGGGYIIIGCIQELNNMDFDEAVAALKHILRDYVHLRKYIQKDTNGTWYVRSPAHALEISWYIGLFQDKK